MKWSLNKRKNPRRASKNVAIQVRLWCTSPQLTVGQRYLSGEKRLLHCVQRRHSQKDGKVVEKETAAPGSHKLPRLLREVASSATAGSALPMPKRVISNIFLSVRCSTFGFLFKGSTASSIFIKQNTYSNIKDCQLQEMITGVDCFMKNKAA